MKKIVFMAAAMAIAITAQAKTSERTENDNTEDSIVVVDYQNAMFPGGDQACKQWIERHIKYPASCAERNVEGTVTARFVIDESGNVSDVRVDDTVDYTLEEEVKRVLAMMPRWQPGTANGQPTRARYSLPIVFRMQQND